MESERGVLVYKLDALVVKVKRERMKGRFLFAHSKSIDSHWFNGCVTQTDLYTSLITTLMFPIDYLQQREYSVVLDAIPSDAVMLLRTQ